MFIYHQTRGFVLKKENAGEADQFFWIYTHDYGKIVVSAKAIRRLNSKLRSAIDVFYLSEVEFIRGKARKTLTSAILIDKFIRLRKNLLQLRLAYRFSRLLCRVVRNEEKDIRLWRLLEHFFGQLDQSALSLKQSVLFYYYFFWNLFKILGYHPELKQCIFCRQRIVAPPAFFGVKEGGLVCGLCQKKSKTQIIKIEPESVKTLKLIFSRDWSDIKTLKINSGLLSDFKTIGKEYLKIHA